MAVPAIAVQPNWYVKVEPVIYGIWLGLPNVILNPAATQAGPREAKINGLFGGNCAHVLQAGQKNLVEGENSVALLHIFAKQRKQVCNELLEVIGQVFLDPADAEVVVHHAGAGNGFKHRLDAFPSAEGEHGGSHCPGVQTDCTNVQQMAGDAVQFAKNDPDVLRPLRHFQVHQLFHRLAVHQFIVEVGYVIQPVKKRDYLVILLSLAQLFRAPVQVADVRLDVDYLLPVNPQHHAKHPVGGRVLWPHVEEHFYRLGVCRRVGRQAGLDFCHADFASYPVGILR